MQRRLLSCTCLLALSLSLTATLAAQGEEMPKPGPEHQKLAKTAGTWDAVVESTSKDGKPEKTKGTAERRTFGGFWLTEDFTGTFAGMPFQGHGVLGYDPIKKKYVESWSDSMSPVLMTLEGTFDKDGKVLTMTGQGPGMGGKMVTMRAVTTCKDDNTMVFEMFTPGPDGKDVKMLTITYTRRGGKADTPPAPKR
jgi:uncharacterized protein DUF1579